MGGTCKICGKAITTRTDGAWVGISDRNAWCGFTADGRDRFHEAQGARMIVSTTAAMDKLERLIASAPDS